MRILFTLFLTVPRDNQPMEYIGMDVHDRYCQVAILDDNTTEPEECRIQTERAELVLIGTGKFNYSCRTTC